MGNPIAIDYTLPAMVILFLAVCLILFLLLFKLASRFKQKRDAEVLRRLDRIIDLLENGKKN